MKRLRDEDSTYTKNQTDLVREAVDILETEAKSRVEDIQQHIEFVCTSLRAQSSMQIGQLLLAVRKLTVEEYCNKYGADPQTFLAHQARKRKRAELKIPNSKIYEKENLYPAASNTKHVSSGSGDRTTIIEKEKLNSIYNKHAALHNDKDGYTEVVKTEEEKTETDFGPLFVHLERPNHPKLTFRLDPQMELQQAGHFTLNAPSNIINLLSTVQKRRIRNQVQAIQDQLEALKSKLC
ncbi:hypothetical protein DFQ30_006758 [Apophysomyces sp. BC1015]|nr:hypothetical protein DFQ30_006758 [Apophysomyces sp. BC1015]KAG0176786.1 hypothetical protein DFQ29_005653 [Apophysomyces sp. BC1021]